MTHIEIEVSDALRRLFAETAPDALPALLARLEEQRLHGENRLTALVDLIPWSCSGCRPSDTGTRTDRGEQEEGLQTAAPESDTGGLDGVEPATFDIDAGGLESWVHPAVMEHGGQ
jgi:hypothetical protein